MDPGWTIGGPKKKFRKEYFPVAASPPKKLFPRRGGAIEGGMVINRVASIGAMVTTTLQKMHSDLAFCSAGAEAIPYKRIKLSSVGAAVGGYN